eukprot:COSAG06_NODE_38062_length_427_cov_418.009146_1_plen_100_part_01
MLNMPSFYQDRLGTNTGKEHSKKREIYAFFSCSASLNYSTDMRYAFNLGVRWRPPPPAPPATAADAANGNDDKQQQQGAEDEDEASAAAESSNASETEGL